jgi:hypothetical protein
MRRILTNDQVKILAQNKNVRHCSTKSIGFKKKFKEQAMELYNKQGLAAVEIFQQAGFDLDVIGKRTPNKLMHQWNKALSPYPQVKRIKPKLSEEAKNENNLRRLKARVAYLEAENDFLAQLRARRKK